MPRQLRLQVPGGVFHLTARGNRRQEIFTDERDRRRFLAVLAAVTTKYSWRVHAYCLMGNHYHLLVHTPQANLSEGMQELQTRYAQWFNHRHGFVGHLFQGRFHSVLVESNVHLIELSRYIVLNPVRAGLCGTAGEWPWSSYSAAVAKAAQPPFLDVHWLMAQFGASEERARERYATFVAEGAKRARSP